MARGVPNRLPVLIWCIDSRIEPCIRSSMNSLLLYIQSIGYCKARGRSLGEVMAKKKQR